MHLDPLIQDLGLILIAAALMTLLFKKMKQPIVLGYLLAGFLVGPYFSRLLEPYFSHIPSVKEVGSIKTWAEIGIVFMLFGLGLEFSFKKLLQVGKTASITAVVEIGFMILVGFLIGRAFGWDWLKSLFLGAILSMSSTTIIVKAFDELQLKRRSFAPVVFGILIVEDLIAILLLVILTSVSVTQSLSGTELLLSSLKLAFFLILWFIMGIFLLPIFLRYCRNLLSDEILLLVSIGLCFMMVIVANHTGFSAALGAFVMGSILAETSKRNRIEHLILPVKDLFSAVFFVSVGMMIEPVILKEHWNVIAILVGVTIVGKFFGTTLGAALSGQNVRDSTQAGMSMAQVGEFSFIIAMLGIDLKVTGVLENGEADKSLYAITVAVSAVTTLTTPFLIKFSDPFSLGLHRVIPKRIQNLLVRYEAAMKESGRESAFSLFWKVYGISLILNSVIIVGITLVARYFQDSLMESLQRLKFFQQENGFRWGQYDLTAIVICFLTLFISTPFLWAILRNRPPRTDDYDTETLARLMRLQVGVSLIRFLVGSLLIAFIVANFISMRVTAGLLALVAASTFILLFSRFFEPLYLKIERNFLSNLTEKERAIIEERAKLSHLVPWEARLTEFTVSEFSPLVMKTIMDSGLKNDYGVTIAVIKRGEKTIVAPRSYEILLPCDKIYLIGTNEQLFAVRDVIERRLDSEEETDDENFGLVSLVLHSGHSFVDKPIRECGLRDAVNGLIVGLERGDQRYLNPPPMMTLLPGDLIWLVGDKELIQNLE
ncbi:MAG: cation:proton antiporter [Planctomycetaceae bacterium]|jgi:CPA2 family monovalent cation:H+ antiporter-2|nr:cation:proton antiporter [Planctomycetaceae bacterium]